MKNITLTLYAFHLKQGLGDSPETAQTQGSKMWESLAQLSQTYPFPELKKLRSQLISYHPDSHGHYTYQPQNEADLIGECLTPQQTEIQLSPIPTTQGFNLSGEIEPYLFHDTYCLTLTLNPSQCHFELSTADLAPLHPQRLITDITADLGKILIFYGEQDNWGEGPTSEDAEIWAIALCAHTGQNPQFRDQLTLFNCPVFWFETPDFTLWILLAKPDQFDAEQFSKNSPLFRGLLWSYTKINCTEQNAKQAYESAKQAYQQLEQQVGKFHIIAQKPTKERLDDLETMIQTVPQDLLYYHCCLRDLKTHQTTIKTNLTNFQTKLTQLTAISGNHLEPWSTLATTTYPRHLKQITLYLEHLEPGKEVFSDLINTIRATTEIERAKNEQILQHHIQSVGIGIAAGAIVASSSGLILQPKTERLTLGNVSLHPLWWALLASVICALGAWQFADFVFKRLRGDRLPWPFPQGKSPKSGD